jgi:hypothetical protein
MYSFDIEALREDLAGIPATKTAPEMEGTQPSTTKKTKRNEKTSENQCKGLRCAWKWKCRHNPGPFCGIPMVSAESKCPSCYEIEKAVRYTKAAETALLANPKAINTCLKLKKLQGQPGRPSN